MKRSVQGELDMGAEDSGQAGAVPCLMRKSRDSVPPWKSTNIREREYVTGRPLNQLLSDALVSSLSWPARVVREVVVRMALEPFYNLT